MRLSNYLIVLLACAISIQMFSFLYKKSTEEHSQELNEYIAIFHEEMDKRNVKLDYSNIDITFQTSLAIPSAAALSYSVYHKKYIEVLKKYYVKASKEVKEALVIHELGHSFGLNHLDDYMYFLDRICAVSVMHSSDDMAGCYTRYRSYYFDELAMRIKKLDKKPELN